MTIYCDGEPVEIIGARNWETALELAVRSLRAGGHAKDRWVRLRALQADGDLTEIKAGTIAAVITGISDDWSISVAQLALDHRASEVSRDSSTGAISIRFSVGHMRDMFERAFPAALGLIKPYGEWGFVVSEVQVRES